MINLIVHYIKNKFNTIIRTMQQYCIHEKDSISNEKIIQVVESTIEFKKTVLELAKSKYNCTILNDISIVTLGSNDFFTQGYYLLNNANEIELVHKTSQNNILFTWKLLPYVTAERLGSEKSLNVIPTVIEKSTYFPDSLLLSESEKLNDYFKNDHNITTSKEKFEIKNFDPNTLCEHPHILIIGRRGEGKTKLITRLISEIVSKSQRNIGRNITIIDPKQKFDQEYSKFFPNAKIHTEYDESIVKSQLENHAEPGCIVFEDVIHSKKFDKSLYELLINGRHYKQTTILTMQTPLGLPPDLRCNFDYIFMFNENSMIHKKKLWMNYASMFPTFELFEKMFDTITSNYNTMVINNRKHSENINEQVFWFNAVNETQLEKFDLDTMRKNPRILIIGKRGTGKTHLAKRLVDKIGSRNNTTIISPTEPMNEEYVKSFHPKNIHSNFNDEILGKLLFRQTALIQNKAIDPSATLVMDDCISFKENFKSLEINNIIFNSTYYKLSFIMTLSCPMGNLTPNMRDQFDYVFLLRESSVINRKKLWMHYGGFYPTFEEFDKAFEAHTQNYDAMVIDNRKSGAMLFSSD